MAALKPKHFAKMHQGFDASISSQHDCGRWCAPLNGGQPICCTTEAAIPIADKAEWKHLKKRTDLWHLYKPAKGDSHAQSIVDELHPNCVAIECKGAAHCERDNRTLACRAFPFYPYVDKSGEIIGLAYYWIFEDRCWVLSNLEIVEPGFVTQMLNTYEFLFAMDGDEFEAFRDQSAKQRRVFSRWKRAIPLIGLDGKLYKILPKGAGLEPAKPSDFDKHGPYKSKKAYDKAVKEAQS